MGALSWVLKDDVAQLVDAQGEGLGSTCREVARVGGVTSGENSMERKRLPPEATGWLPGLRTCYSDSSLSGVRQRFPCNLLGKKAEQASNSKEITVVHFRGTSD